MKKRIVRSISVLPTLLTLGNAFCGFLAMAYVADALGGFHLDPSVSPDVLLQRSAWLIFLAMVFDALDGRIARITRTDSSFGAELDSLCDVITFGVAPAFLIKVLVQRTSPSLFATHPRIALWFSVLYVACAVLRLARYNVENMAGRKGPAHYFVGLPTPAAAGVLASLVLLHYDLQTSTLLPSLGIPRLGQAAATYLVHVLPFLTLALALLMISRVPFAHMVNRLTRGRRTFGYMVFLIFVVILAVFHTEMVLAVAFGGYVLWSIVAWAVPGPWRRSMTRLVDTQDEDAPEDDDEEETAVDVRGPHARP